MGNLILSIILVNYNAMQITLDCIKSIYEKTINIAFEIILVDNGSDDNAQELVKKEFPNVKIIYNKQNKGFAQANNQAIIISSGKYVLLLNNDTIISATVELSRHF